MPPLFLPAQCVVVDKKLAVRVAPVIDVSREDGYVEALVRRLY
ncbi:hypothetical protein [Marinobacter sp. F3R11]|nr:hypothetical protein [Marinobacter sp. F3R11]